MVEAMPRAEFDAYIAALAAGRDRRPAAGGECETTIEIAAVESTPVRHRRASRCPPDEDFCIEFTNNDTVAAQRRHPEEIELRRARTSQPGESITYVSPGHGGRRVHLHLRRSTPGR